jgi:2-iminobutanoate/2-iminopropanoate deaminase
MPKKILESRNVAKTKGPYVQGVAVTGGQLVYTSGLVARDQAGNMVGHGDIRVQTRQCLENIGHVIGEAGGTLKDIVKVTVFIRHLDDYAGMNEVRREMLNGIPFASSTVQTGLNDPNALVEIEAVALVGRRRVVKPKQKKPQPRAQRSVRQR